MTWSVLVGATFLRPSGPDDKKHLFVVLSNPREIDGYPPNSCLVIPLCSVPQHAPCDRTCIVSPGEHPFVVKQTYAAYRHGNLEQAATILRLVAQGYYVTHTHCNSALVEKMRAGLVKSDETGNWLKDIARDLGWREQPDQAN